MKLQKKSESIAPFAGDPIMRLILKNIWEDLRPFAEKNRTFV
jgi:hypothetical protein